MLSSSVVFHFAFLCIVHHSHGIEPLSRYIAPMDILNEVVNQIFSSLQFKTNNNTRESKIKEYSNMHKYFVSLARLHKNDWIELLKTTILDFKIDNGTGDYTTIINEVLNEENKTEAVNDILSEENVNKHIEDFLGTLENVKELYLRNNSFVTVNYEVLDRFHRNRQSLRNKTVDRLHLAQNDSDFWVPDGRRIYQGKKTKIKHFPFVASVHMFDQFTCAGSIIHADLVITAASCLQLAHNNRFYRENPSYLSVRIGSSTYAGGDRVPVLEVYFYPSYDPKTLKNNLAILRLQRVIKFHKKNKNVKKIRVDTNAWALPSNTDGITIIGWGARKTSNKIYNPWKNKLAMDVLYFYGLADCRDVYSKTLVTKKNFCAGFISRGGGACNRDVGAPGVVDGILVGVVSFGSPNCGARDSPTVFTKLGYYIDWIEDIMAQDPPKQLVRITTRRPHLVHTIKSTRPLHESNFLIDPIDLSKVPDIRDLDVRMPQEDKNEFINNEFNSIQPISSQTFPTSKQIIKPNPKDPKNFIDITRVRDENKNKGSPETTYEPQRLNPIYTVMGNFDEDEILPSSNETFDKTSTIADLLAPTRAQNKELKDAKPQWQIELENSEKSESVEDTTGIPDDTRESVTTHNFELNTTPFNIIDKKFVANHTDADKILSSDEYADDIGTIVVQQSLPVHPISKENVLSIKNHDKAIVNEKKSGVRHKVKQPVKSLKEQDLDKEIDKFIENLDFEEVLLSDENLLNTQVLTDTEFPEQHKNKKVTLVPVNHNRYTLQDQKTKPTLKNYNMNHLRDLAPKNDSTFPLHDQKTKPAPTNDNVLPLKDQKTQPSSAKTYTFLILDEKTESTQTNDYMYPQQDQEVEPSSNNDHMFPLQGQKTKPPPKTYYLDSKQGQKTKPTSKKSAQKNYNLFPLRDLAPKNVDFFPLQDEKVELAPTNYYMYPQKDQETRRPPKNDFRFPLQDKAEPAPTNDYFYEQQDQETELVTTNDDKFPLQDHKTRPASKKYYLNQQQHQKKKAPPKNDFTFPLLNEAERTPTNDYMYAQRDQVTELAPTNDDKFPLQDHNARPPPKEYYLNQQKYQKKKAPPKNDFTFPLLDEAERTPTNDYMYAQRDQVTELAPTNDDKFPLQDHNARPPSKVYYLNQKKYQKKKAPPKNDFTFPLLDEAERTPTNDYMYAQRDQVTELAPTNDHKFSLQDRKIKPPSKKYYLNQQQHQKKKAPPKNDFTFPLLDEAEQTPTNDYVYTQQDQVTELAPTNDHKFSLQDRKIKPPSKKYYLNQQQHQKKKAPPKNDFTFPLLDEAEPRPTNEYMFAQQDQVTELAPTNDHKFSLQDHRTKPPPKKYYTIPLQYEEIKPALTNDDGLLRQPQKVKMAPTHHVVPPLKDQKAKPAQVNSDVLPLHKIEPKPAPKGDDILSFLYLSENERKPDDSSPEALSIERKKFKDLTMSLVFDVIAEELRKKEGSAHT